MATLKKAAFVFIGTVLMAGSFLPAAHATSGRVVVIVLENEEYAQIIGSAQAPYINSLVSQGELFSSYTAVTNGSLHNYLGMTSGLTSVQSPPSLNVFQAIDGTSGAVAWTEFEESMPGNCGAGTPANVPGTRDPLYTKSHDPVFKYRANTTCKQNDVPMTTTTFNPAALPSFTYIVPNQCDDMHTLPKSGQACPAYFGSNAGSTAVKIGDNWLSAVVPQLLAQPDITVVLTWDEGINQSGQHIVTLEVGAGITAGTIDGTAYNHFGLEAGLYGVFGLGTAPNNGATATPLPIP